MSLYNSQTVFDSPSFCVLPFVGTCIEAGGRFKPCCKYKGWSREFSAKEVPLQKIVDSDLYKKIREDIYAGRMHEGCQRCYQDEKLGLRSMRLAESEKTQGYVFSEDMEKPNIKILDYGFGNHCNAKCITCESSSSSLWHEDDVYLQNIDNNVFQRVVQPITKDEFSWDQADYARFRFVTHAQNEVMISPAFPKSLRKMKEAGSLSQSHFLVSTNGGTRPSQEIVELLYQAKSVTIQLSIDGHGERNDYIRFPLKWKKIEETTAYLRQIMLGAPNRFQVVCHCTLSTYNILYTMEIREFLHRVAPEFSLKFGRCWFPDYLASRNLPPRFKDVLREKIKDPQVLHLLGHESPSMDAEEAFGLFKKFTRIMDSRRETRFAEVFPELQDVLNV